MYDLAVNAFALAETDFPIAKNMTDADPKAAFDMLYGSSYDFLVKDLNDNELAAELMLGVPIVARVYGDAKTTSFSSE